MALSRRGPEAYELFSRANEKFKEALKIKPNDYRALYNWGFCLGKQAELSGSDKYVSQPFYLLLPFLGSTTLLQRNTTDVWWYIPQIGGRFTSGELLWQNRLKWLLVSFFFLWVNAVNSCSKLL
jgi:tetratricopeptide (TPR) repeat protein